jgi:hypothetical protein
MNVIINCLSYPLELVSRYDHSVVLARYPAAQYPVRPRTEVAPDTLHADGVDVPVVALDHIETHYLPAQADGVFYIVDKLTQHAHPDRSDLLSVFEAVRREDGKPKAVLSFSLRRQSAPVTERYSLPPVLHAQAEVVR